MNIKTTSLILLCATTALAKETQKRDKKSTPNILIILLDDAGYNDFGFMGCKDLKTPNIDKLASNGIIFSDAHVSASVSGPSRAGILTGRYQQRNGYECNLNDTLGLGLKEKTIGNIFKEQGYATACIGKWHQGNGPLYHPNKRGFDYFCGFIAGGRSYFFNPRDDKPGDIHNLEINGKQLKFNGYMTDVLAHKASEYIKEETKKEKPFMLYLAFNAVHTPLEATKEDLEKFKGHTRQQLAAMTWAVDRGIGEVITTLKETNQYDNTLIFFLSDNGGAFNNQSCNKPLKGFKGNKFEGGHRVPFFMVWSNKFKGSYDGLTSSMDILATAATAAGINIEKLEKKLDGVDLIPYLEERKTSTPHKILFWRKQDMAAVRKNEYKLIRVKGVGKRLYNLSTNLKETKDLQYDYPKLTQELEEALNNWEKELINPILWNEGIWNSVTKQIHKDLMENKNVSCYTPYQWNKKYGDKR